MGFSLPSTAGIEAFEPAVLFAVLYVVLVLLYIGKTARNPAQYAFIALVFFCVFRMVGFILRAILAASDGAKQNTGLVISEMIFFALGFVGLLYSVFILILSRAAAARQLLGEDEDQPSSWMLSLILSRHITDLTFTAAAGVSITAAAYTSSDQDLSERLRKVSIILYLEITCCLSIQAAILMHKERKTLRLVGQRETVGQPYVVYILCVILVLLLIRQAYLLATFGPNRKDHEGLWYPLFATPEFLAACLFSTPGLVSHPAEPSEEDKKRSYWSRLWRAFNTSA